MLPRIIRAGAEGLPCELRIMILQALPDVDTLRNLILAYPLYHKMYPFMRRRNFTEVTLRDLKGRGFDLLAVQLLAASPLWQQNSLESLHPPGDQTSSRSNAETWPPSLGEEAL